LILYWHDCKNNAEYVHNEQIISNKSDDHVVGGKFITFYSCDHNVLPYEKYKSYKQLSRAWCKLISLPIQVHVYTS